jgi:hypothetical protein
MNEVEKRFLENRFLNLDARCTAIEVEFTDYMETNPKGDDQWTEVRLRAIEDWQRDAKQVHNADIKRIFKDFENLTDYVFHINQNTQKLISRIEVLENKQNPISYNPEDD